MTEWWKMVKFDGIWWKMVKYDGRWWELTKGGKWWFKLRSWFMLHPYNNSTNKLLSLVPAVVFSGPFY